MSSRLPFEILQVIFEHCTEEDDQEYKSVHLHQLLCFLLVNRDWCAAAVTLLWKTPFTGLWPAGPQPYSQREKNKRKATKLIQTYLASMTEAELCRCGIHARSSAPTLFDYPSMLKNLDFCAMYASCQTWVADFYIKRQQRAKQIQQEVVAFIDDQHRGSILRQLLKNVVATLLKSFNTQGAMLIKLRLDPRVQPTTDWFKILKNDCDMTDYWDMAGTNYMPLLGHNVLPMMTALRELEIIPSFEFSKEKLFRVLSTTCRSLQKVKVSFDAIFNYPAIADEFVCLAALLGAQKGLRAVHLKGHGTSNIDKIITALLQSSSSLCSLTFENINFESCPVLDILSVSGCHNLEELIFQGCDLGTELNTIDVSSLLKSKSFPSLRLCQTGLFIKEVGSDVSEADSIELAHWRLHGRYSPDYSKGQRNYDSSDDEFLFADDDAWDERIFLRESEDIASVRRESFSVESVESALSCLITRQEDVENQFADETSIADFGLRRRRDTHEVELTQDSLKTDSLPEDPE